MKVSTEGNSEIIEIKLTGKHPEETAELLDAIVDAHVKEANSQVTDARIDEA